MSTFFLGLRLKTQLLVCHEVAHVDIFGQAISQAMSAAYLRKSLMERKAVT